MRAHGPHRSWPPLVWVCALAAVAWAGCASKPQEAIRTDQAAATANNGFCRSSTCPAPRTYPKDGLCEPSDWPQTCAAQGYRDIPLWWKSGCLGYSLQKDAGKHVSYDDVSAALTQAFAAWTTRSCASDGQGSSHPSIDVRDLGPVECAEVNYDRYGPNQNVVMFRDNGWPHKEKKEDLLPDGRSPTIALTTVTFNSDTGEILDADMEINSADHDVVPLQPDSKLDGNTYDLQAVLTHEVGHIFGLAHAPSDSSVMYLADEGADIKKRLITATDVRAICAVYPPDGTRSVASVVEPSGKLPQTACDPTPRRGFTSVCRHDDPPGACAMGRSGAGTGALFLSAAAASLAVLRRRRPRRA